MLFDWSHCMKFSDTGLVRLEPRARVYLRKPVDLVFQKTRMLTCQYLLLLHLLLPSASEKVINNPSAKQGRDLTLRICAVHHVFLSSLHLSSVHSLSALSHGIVRGQNGHRHGRQHRSGQGSMPQDCSARSIASHHRMPEYGKGKSCSKGDLSINFMHIRYPPGKSGSWRNIHLSYRFKSLGAFVPASSVFLAPHS